VSRSLALQIQGQVPLSAQTVCVLGTEEGPVIAAGGEEPLNPQQIKVAQKLGCITPPPSDVQLHAEMEAVWTAGELGLTPTEGWTSNKTCETGEENCVSQLNGILPPGWQLLRTPDGYGFSFQKPSSDPGVGGNQ
jgi:hypothetical protein